MVERLRKNGRTSAGAQQGPRRGRKRLDETETLTPENVAAFDGELIVVPAPELEQEPRASYVEAEVIFDEPFEENAPKRWEASDDAARERAARIDRLSSGAEDGWRYATREELLARIVDVRSAREAPVQWQRHLDNEDRQRPGSVTKKQRAAAEKNIAAAGRDMSTELLTEAYGLRFGDVPEPLVAHGVRERMDQARRAWSQGEPSDYPQGRARKSYRPMGSHRGDHGHARFTQRTRERTASQFFLGKPERMAREFGRAREQKNHESLLGNPHLSDQDQIRLMQLDSRKAAEDYMTSLRESNIFVAGFSKEELKEQISMSQRVYHKVMLMGALAPLRNGVSTNSVIQALGAMTTMAIMSPPFRQELGEYKDALLSGVKERINDRARGKGEKAQARAEQFNARVNAETAEMLKRNPALANDPSFREEREDLLHSRDDLLSRRWRKRLNKIEFAERGNREPFTVESAAMTQIGLAENAFYAMRNPDADPAVVKSSYSAMMRRLHDQMGEDGLDRAEVAKTARTILGRRLETEPELSMVFSGLAYGKYRRSADHPVRIPGTDRTEYVWTGEFEDHLGKKVPDDAMFTVREKMDADEHQVAIQRLMVDRLVHDLKTGGMASYNHSFEGYAVAFSVIEDRLHDSAEPVTFRDLPEGVHASARQTEQILAAMRSDGLDSEQRRMAFSGGYASAIEEVRGMFPDFEKDWDQAYGASWKARMDSAMSDPKSFYAWSREQHPGWEAGESTKTYEPAPEAAWGREREREQEQAAEREDQPTL